jgi:hypothetical protein
MLRSQARGEGGHGSSGGRVRRKPNGQHSFWKLHSSFEKRRDLDLLRTHEEVNTILGRAHLYFDTRRLDYILDG